ncbi:ferrous iron transport protein A [Paucidesulfovibrio gracilis DSM 16080]|uniref:Ferrous iron transport protein A n=1 Tax=Paucidesulfovibrio gracilis DSM 16080 TaxID=1121449 RepID=A0A1T4XFH3_9BACT|nr:FeoA domain-containing protein [Paucidesulfovibrio gracilis]SKA88342.1 ferrous iron transport protein A [Paucidesulfovibrio gracilis DSM 16080]
MSEVNMKSQPLCRFPQGTKVRVKDLAQCRGARSRLYALGLTPGTELEVMSAPGGPCRLRVRGANLTIGHGLATKILVCPVDGCPARDCPDGCGGACPGVEVRIEDDDA